LSYCCGNNAFQDAFANHPSNTQKALFRAAKSLKGKNVAAMAPYVIEDSDDELPFPPAPKRKDGGNDGPKPAKQPGYGSAASRTVSSTTLKQQKLEVEHQLDVLQEEIDARMAEKNRLLLVKKSIESQLRQNEDAEERAERQQYKNENRKIDWKSASAFAWSSHLPEMANHFFNLSTFRPGQLEAMNATMSHRDVFMIAATGHGKSLTYQLPALLHDSFTLVVSPLVSLSRDQVLGLKDKGIHAAMLYAQTPKDEEKKIMDEMLWGGGGQPKSKSGSGSGVMAAGARDSGPPNYEEYLESLGPDEEPYDGSSLRLVYCTPEKLNKSKRFVNLLEKCYARGKIARIVIDEAHCVSNFSHDFRPDYKKLGILKQLFPNVPLLCLSATCPPSLVASCFQILGLRDVDSDPRRGCFIFSTELYRPNLHYKVVSKSTSSESQYSEIADYIRDNHEDETGIVYCLTRKDAENTAAGLVEKGIDAGVYHADCSPADRDRVHRQWRAKKLKVICATIAFGLGVDLPDVRFVLHASLAKSVEGYYQESGRAGRDGKDASCILFYRASDFSRLSSMCAGDAEGKRGVLGMLKYCEDLTTCRRLLMERYFGRDGVEGSDACGHCDNCNREATSIVQTEVTAHAASVCTLLEGLKSGASKAKGEKVTLLKLIDLWRGNGLNKQSASVAVLVPAEAKKQLTRQQMEKIVVTMVIEGLIEEDLHFSAYATVSYLRNTDKGSRLARLSSNLAQAKKVFVAFESAEDGAGGKKRKRSSVGGSEAKDKGKSKPGSKRSSMAAEEAIVVDDSDDDDWLEQQAREAIEEDELEAYARPSKKKAYSEEDEDEEEEAYYVG